MNLPTHVSKGIIAIKVCCFLYKKEKNCIRNMYLPPATKLKEKNKKKTTKTTNFMSDAVKQMK